MERKKNHLNGESSKVKLLGNRDKATQPVGVIAFLASGIPCSDQQLTVHTIPVHKDSFIDQSSQVLHDLPAALTLTEICVNYASVDLEQQGKTQGQFPFL